MKKKTLKLAGLICLVIVLVAFGIGYRLYTKPHRSVMDETAMEVSAPQLLAAFEKDEPAANKKYLGRAVQVSGTVSETSLNQQQKPVLVLTGDEMSGVQCTLLDAAPGIRKGDQVTIKGFCNGFLTDVVLNSCVLVNK